MALNVKKLNFVGSGSSWEIDPFFFEFFFTGFALLCLGINKHGRNVMTGKMPESRPLCHALPVRVITVCVLGDMRSTGVPVHKYIEHFAFLFHISRTCLV